MTGYAGDVTPTEAWEQLKANPDALLIDVRSQPEWAFVGVADLSSIGKKAQLISWQVYPDMSLNASFAEQVESVAPSQDTPIFFLCRSGARSRSAAIALTARGYGACYNVAYGFEGDPDASRHRGRMNGWKASALPWFQQ